VIDGQTPLHFTARLGRPEIAAALLEAGCDPNPFDAQGMTPELLAIANDHQCVAKVIGRHLDDLESKADQDPSPSIKPSREKPWLLPLARSSDMTQILTANVSIYAVQNTERTEVLRKALGEKKDQGVYSLGRIHKRLIQRLPIRPTNTALPRLSTQNTSTSRIMP